MAAALGVPATAQVVAPAPAAQPAPGQNPELARVRAEREQLGVQLDDVTSELEQLNVRITDAQAERDRLQSDVDALHAAAVGAQELVQAQVVQAYMHGDFGPVSQLFTAVQPGDAIERTRMLAGLSLREREMVERAVLARGALASREADLDRVLGQLRRDEARVSELRAQLDSAFAIAKATEEVLVSLSDRQRMVARPGQKGVYACPMQAPYHFRDTWGAPRSGGRSHKGVDMFAVYNSEVYAITDGVIERHSSSGLGGIGLYLSGDDGNVYYYAHLASILPAYRPGKRVKAGELIARNGDSGNAFGGAPHVHMEVRPGGGANINPYPFSAAACF
jgi:murein DD-endopeptidase MepM/ murein hydrolase activator NlpD